MNIFLILLIVSLAISAIGWKKFLYFISLGYGFSIAGCAIAIVAVFWHQLTLPTALLCLILFIYGCRLGGFLLIRNLKSASYQKALSENVNEGTYPFGLTFAIWVSCAALYMAEVAPVAARLSNMADGLPVDTLWAWIGVIVMVLGVLIEAIADAQKSAAKKKDPRQFVSTGLYRLVRCPNYFGEVIVWTGCLLVCFGACCTWWQWLISILGYVGIVYVMFSGARRLEIRQNENYGIDPRYQEYAKNTPILIPFLPIYSVERFKWLRG